MLSVDSTLASICCIKGTADLGINPVLSTSILMTVQAFGAGFRVWLLRGKNH
ncbi:hypothetical protein O9929_17080 [Vibrio lentus]|nr:hypothetical protein [Vibrio lentus]